MIIRPCRVSAFCVHVVSVVPIIFRKCRIHFSTKFLVHRGLFLKSFVLTLHAQISAYACLVNETHSFKLKNEISTGCYVSKSFHMLKVSNVSWLL